MALLFCDPALLRPLPKSLQGIACAVCDRTRAVWENTKSIDDLKGECVCSLCWIYDSPWSEGTREDLDVLIGEVEAKMGVSFAKNADGRLTVCADADRILGAIVMTSRMFLVRGKVRELDK